MTERYDDADDLVSALREENDSLRARVAELEATTNEYRRQMTVVLTSVSWRITSPLRMSAGRMRLFRRRLREAPARLARRDRTPRASTLGLFHPIDPPTTGLATAASPLLANRRGDTRRRRDPGATDRAAKVLVVAHVFYPEVWLDLEDRLARLPEHYDLLIALVRGRAESLEPDLHRRLPHARIHVVDNYGRDYGSLVEFANRGLFDGYDAILKIHTKRSPHRLDGDAWRVQLLDDVLPSPEGIRRIIELLRLDPTVGIVAPSGSLKGAETWGSNRELVAALAARVPMAFDPDAITYPSGSMYWARPWVLQRFADLALQVHDFEREADHLDGSTAHALERFIGVLTQSSGLRQVETPQVPSLLHRARRHPPARARVLAFYLPQYHRIPENDAWWGAGFTDWVNVDAARPAYDGHAQPQQPGELGRYDLSDPDVMRAQGALALAHGVSGFVMHHYWFDGRRLLDAPLRHLLADPTIEFPFALCWANESWTRRWDGLDSDVLIEQTYSAGWADRFYDDIAPALRDHRYLRVSGKPLLVVYRIGQVQEARAAVLRWKERAEADGLGGLHVLAVVPSRDFEGIPADVADVLDGLVHFPPGSGIGLQSVRELAPGLSSAHSGDVYSYDAAVDGASLATEGAGGLRVHPGVMPGWDNTARRGGAAYVFHGANPASFRRWVARAVSAAAAAGPEPLVFVNAWNEWAEGAHLEPDVRFDRGNIEAVRDVVGSIPAVVDTEASPAFGRLMHETVAG